ncbi:MAG TPA: GNAT family protein [Rubrobacter sp.]|nr:GNAT family protein [Rubrobacter sp.]
MRLRPLVQGDVPLLTRWLFDPDVLHWLHLSEDPTELRAEEAVRERFERMQADPFTETWRIDSAEGKPVGQIELVDIHPLQRRAEMHLLVGEKNVWGRGYGSRAVRRLLGHAFEDLNLRRVFAMADEDNGRVIRLFERCGFAREGLLRRHRLRHGQPVDMVVMGVLEEEYRASNDRSAGT